MIACDIASTCPGDVAWIVSRLGVVANHSRVAVVPIEAVRSVPDSDVVGITAKQGNRAQLWRIAVANSAPE
jgi:hypothetical protein